MPFTVEDSAGNEISYRRGSVQFDDTINKRGTMRFEVIGNRFLEAVGGGFVELVGGGSVMLSGHNLPIDVGADIYVKSGGVSLWGGTVEQCVETDLSGGATTHNVFRYTCIDFDEIAGRRLVAESFSGQSAGDIVESIRATYLSEYGVTAGTIASGPVIESISFNYVTPEQVLDELATITGFAWCINADKEIQFEPRDQQVAAWHISPSSRPYRGIRITKNRSKYRNTQFIRAGFDLTGDLTETADGDGETQSFPLAYGVGAEPAIRTDTGAGLTSRTVGILGVDTGKDWYYAVGSNIISQDTGGTALASGDTIEVTYKGRFPIIVKAEDEVELAARAAVEEGSGLYESIQDDTTITDDDAALDKALGLLSRHGSIPVTVQYETDTAGLLGGVLQSISLPEHGLSGQWLLEQVSARDRGDGELTYTVRALSGQAIGGWAAFFKSLIKGGRDFVIRDNEVLIILRSPRDYVSIVGAPAAATYAAGYTVDGADTYIGGFYVA